MLHPFSITNDQLNLIKSNIENFNEASVKSNIANYRTDKTKWLDPLNSFDNDILGTLRKVQKIFDGEPFLKTHNIEAHYAYYSPGSYYKKHRDSFKRNNKRILTMVTYLNPEWDDDGGELLLYDNDSIEKINPIMNTSILFLSDMEHEVLPSKCDRWSIAAWFTI